jgi:hypothetical protein
MTATTRRRRPVAGYVIREPLQRWRIIDGRFYRDAVVELPDGTLHLFSIPDPVAA